VNSKKLLISMMLAGLTCASGSAMADADQPWHVTGDVGGMSLDSDRDTRDDDIWWSVGFGRFLGNNFSLDIEYDKFSGTYRGYNEQVPGATYDQWGLENWGLKGRYYFGDKDLRPFISAGIGLIQHRNVMDEGEALGGGVGFGLAGKVAEHWSARAEMFYRIDSDSRSLDEFGSYDDWIYSIGLSFDFGGKPPPPPPPPKSEPPPPPPPPPNPDLDGDGVPNERDKCPNTRPGAVVDLDGCEIEAVIELDEVHFDFDKATLKPEGKANLDKAAALLDKHPRVVVEVAGHTDSIGSDAYNQALSERRAIAAKDYLVSKGVAATRLTAKGYGESQPVASNDTDAGRAMNRRVELIVLDR